MNGGMARGGISLLNFDGTLQQQPLLREYPGEWIDFSDMRGCHGYCADDSLRQIRKRLNARKHKRITSIGNGNFHYVTYVLLSEIRHPFSLILFDHHTDMAPDDDVPLLSCGSWVGVALRTLPLLHRAVIIGAPSPNRRLDDDLTDKVAFISEDEVCRSSPAEVARAVRAALSDRPDQPLYLSVDKDVLDREHAATNWDQGSMTLPQLLDVIRELKRAHPLAGADVCGELPLSPVERLSGERVRHLKKNELANKAIVDTLLAG
jgi:arginase family enzyme